MGRPWQVFVAPGPDDDPLPIDPSPWHDGREARIPKEHWDLVLEFGERFGASLVQQLRAMSWSTDADSRIRAPAESIESAAEFLHKLEGEVVKADALVPVATEDVPDEFENEEHARMLQAVEAVLRESLRLGLPFRAWID